MCYTDDMAKTAYTKVQVEGFTLNARTAALYEQVKRIYPLMGGTGKIYIAQGSYSDGVSQSAGTHDGGGAIDLMVSFQSAKNWAALQRAVRWVQFAGWHRDPSQGPWGDHVHGIVVGDISATPIAKEQVIDYKETPPKNGLKGHAVDNTWHPDKIFTPSYPLGTVNYKNMVRESKKTRGWLPFPGIKRVQTALNLKLGLSLPIDGKFGPKTKAAYKKWEIETGTVNPDGVPGPRNLVLLGAGRFNVV